MGYSESYLKGKKFGALTFVARHPGSMWTVACECGSTRLLRAQAVTSDIGRMAGLVEYLRDGGAAP